LRKTALGKAPMKIFLAKGLTTSSKSLEFKAWQGNGSLTITPKGLKGNKK
jgi:hypothetical protein